MIETEQTVQNHDNQRCEKLNRQTIPNSNLLKGITYHAVYIPYDNKPSTNNGKCIAHNEKVHIYTEKNEPLRLIKEYKNARLKSFKTLSEAEEFVKTGSANSKFNNTSSSAPVEEKSSNFKSLRPQELVGLRKLIESGDLEAVRNIVYENPRYLVSSGDTPAVLQEGCRYNALHVAVKAGKVEMCDLILNTIGNPKFVELLYGEDESQCYLDRTQILLDLYLNTPDKGLNETPLHFAVKFGEKDIVRVLVSYERCIKTVPNKYNQKPIDIICSRKCQDNEELKKEIRMLLEDQFYVPVLRSEGNALQPIIGLPFCPNSPPNLNPFTDPISPRYEVQAVAGPMTKTQATEFRKKWKTPPRLFLTPEKRLKNVGITSPLQNSICRFQDTEKGLECFGRDLAEENKVDWKEFWPFLDGWADLRKVEGLAKFEKYLETRYKELLFFYKNKVTIKDEELDGTDTNLTGSLENNFQEQLNVGRKVEENPPHDFDNMCNRLHSLTVTDCNLAQDDTEDADADAFFTPSSSPVMMYDSDDDDMMSAEEGVAIYIEGDFPTKLDYAVHNAIISPIDLNTYPNIYRWKHEMSLIIKKNSIRNSFASVRKRLIMSP